VGEVTRKLLVVEDDLGLQKQLKWCFDGYEVITAENREDAVAQIRRHEPPVVLQDLGLPPEAEGVGEGFATLHEILTLAPRTKVIVVTGNDERDNAVRAVGAGAYDFYSKPVDVDVLQLLVNRAFTLWELRSHAAALPEDREDRRSGCHDAPPRRERHGQGDLRQGPARLEPARRPSVRRHQLRSHPREPA
jgi:two-component system NtrC family response regulator